MILNNSTFYLSFVAHTNTKKWDFLSYALDRTCALPYLSSFYLRLCLEIMPSWQNEIYLWRMATKVRMTLRLTKKLPCPWAEIGKYGPRQGPIWLQDSLACPLRKKMNTPHSRCEIIFPSPEEAWKNTSNEQNFPLNYMSNYRIMDLLFYYYFQY